jgi:tetratricopeptide (TPR) repeat protein
MVSRRAVAPPGGGSSLLESSPTMPPTFVLELLSIPQARRVLRLSNPPKNWSLAEVRELTAFSFSLRFSEPWQMLEFARLACLLAEAMGPRDAAGKDYEDACGEAWSQLGNSNKVVARFRAAETAFNRAKLHLDKGSGAPEILATFWEMFAGLKRAKRRFVEAADALRQAQEYRERVGDIEGLAKCFICQAINYSYIPDPEKAVERAQLAVQLLPGDADQKLIYSAVHTLVSNLVDAGRPAEAAECLLEAEELLDSQRDPLLQARRTWLRGHLDVALGLPTAEVLFKKAARAFEKANLQYEQAQILLELALFYAVDNRDQELSSTINAILPIFKALGIRREAMMARLLARVPRQRREVQRATLLRLYLLVRNSPAPPRKPKG